MTGTGGGERVGSEEGFGLVEALVALVILSIGLLALAGLTLAVAQQTSRASAETDQALAAQQVLEVMIDAGYGTYANGSTDTTVTVGDRTITVTRNVSSAGSSVQEIEIVVPATGQASQATFTTRVHRKRTLPSSP